MDGPNDRYYLLPRLIGCGAASALVPWLAADQDPRPRWFEMGLVVAAAVAVILAPAWFVYLSQSQIRAATTRLPPSVGIGTTAAASLGLIIVAVLSGDGEVILLLVLFALFLSVTIATAAELVRQVFRQD